MTTALRRAGAALLLLALTACGAPAVDRTAATAAGAPAAEDAPAAPTPDASSASAAPTAAPVAQTPTAGTYSNLADPASREQVAAALAAAGVAPERIARFLEQVGRFDAAAPAGTLVPSGVVPLGAEPEDDGTLAEAVQTDPAARPLTNCRITTFTLLGDRMHVGSPVSEPSTRLVFDLESVDGPPALFTPAERADFVTLYAPVPTTRAKDDAQHLADIRAFRAAHGITFTHGAVSTVEVWFHDTIDPEAFLFVGHVGVLVETGGRLLFLEKLTFDAPYQAVWFDDRTQRRDYLRGMYDDGPDRDYSSPLILENGDLLVDDGSIPTPAPGK